MFSLKRLFETSGHSRFQKSLKPWLISGILLSTYVMLMASRKFEPSSLPHSDKSLSPENHYLKLKSSLDSAFRKEDFKKAGLLYGEIGDIFYQAEAMPQALTYYYKADTLLNKENCYIELASNLNKIGRIYFKSVSPARALPVFEQSLGLFQQQRYVKGIAESYGYLSLIYGLLGKHQQSHDYLELALSEYKKIKNKNQIAYTYAQIGSIYEDKKEYQTALTYFFDAYRIYQHESNNEELPGILNNIGDAYRKLGRYQDALKFTKLAELLAVRIKNSRQLNSAYRDLAKTYQQIGRFDSAFYYSEKARIAYAKSYNDESSKKLNLLHTLFAVQQKDNAIEQLEVDKKINRIMTASISFISILIVFSGFNIYSKQRLKSKNEKVVLESQKNAVELELHKKQVYHESLRSELELRSKELTSHTLHIIQKNQFLEELKQKLVTIIKSDKRDQRTELKELINVINQAGNQDKSWDDFRTVYENVHKDFFQKLKAHSSNLTATDLRFLALLKMNLGSADMATMLGVSQDSLRTTRYRIRKKLELSEDEDLLGFIQRL